MWQCCVCIQAAELRSRPLASISGLALNKEISSRRSHPEIYFSDKIHECIGIVLVRYTRQCGLETA